MNLTARRLEPTGYIIPESWIGRGEVTNNTALYDAVNSLSEYWKVLHDSCELVSFTGEVFLSSMIP